MIPDPISLIVLVALLLVIGLAVGTGVYLARRAARMLKGGDRRDRATTGRH